MIDKLKLIKWLAVQIYKNEICYNTEKSSNLRCFLSRIERGEFDAGLKIKQDAMRDLENRVNEIERRQKLEDSFHHAEMFAKARMYEIAKEDGRL